jgi:CHAT domain-containing protein
VATELSTLTYQGSGNISPGVYRRRVDELSKRQEALETQLAGKSSRFRQQVIPTTLEAVRRALPVDAVLVEWLRYRPFDPKAKSTREEFGPPRYAAYVLGRMGDPIAADLGSAEEIENLVDEFRTAAGDPASSDVRLRAAALSRRILEPLRAHIDRARHLLLSPDGALNLVPMAALLDEGARYLVERYEISYLTSGRDLLRVANSEVTPSSNAVVMGNVDYGVPLRTAQSTSPVQSIQERSEELDRSGLNFRSLPGTALEVAAINLLLRPEGVRVFAGEQASEANLKRVHGPRILHLATHGFFFSDQELRKAMSGRPSDVIAENPLLRSGLAFAGANQRRSGLSDDGILTALEASRLDLHGTELVVLSACETGVGEVRAGVGITGLRRGLMLAGARAQISSLWKVADLPTKELMVGFYQRLVKGDGPSAALRRAQREMLGQPAQSHPYYWAGFVSIGDWTPLSTW